jgi:putative transposase
MRYTASEKLEIIRTVETSSLPVRRTLAQIGIPKSTFYTWLDRYAAGGLDALEDRKAKPKRVWNRIPDQVRQKVIACALDQPELSPREVAVTFTDRERTFVSEASVYRLLKAEGLITSPAFIVMKAADTFANPTTAINQLWQTDFTYRCLPKPSASNPMGSHTVLCRAREQNSRARHRSLRPTAGARFQTVEGCHTGREKPWRTAIRMADELGCKAARPMLRVLLNGGRSSDPGAVANGAPSNRLLRPLMSVARLARSVLSGVAISVWL